MQQSLISSLQLTHCLQHVVYNVRHHRTNKDIFLLLVRCLCSSRCCSSIQLDECSGDRREALNGAVLKRAAIRRKKAVEIYICIINHWEAFYIKQTHANTPLITFATGTMRMLRVTRPRRLLGSAWSAAAASASAAAVAAAAGGCWSSLRSSIVLGVLREREATPWLLQP